MGMRDMLLTVSPFKKVIKQKEESANTLISFVVLPSLFNSYEEVGGCVEWQP